MSKGGSAPQPVDPYQQAAAQYGLSTGTALYNAGLNRTNSSNPIGSSMWTTNQGMSPSGYGGQTSDGVPAQLTAGVPAPSSAPPSSGPPGGYNGNTFNVPMGPGDGEWGNPYASLPGASGTPGASTNAPGSVYGLGGAPPTYTLNTQLAPQFQGPLEQPINTSGIAGMPGGPSTTQDLQNTQRSLYNSQMSYIQPQEQLANEQLSSQLAAEGATPGSAAYNNAMDTQNRANTFTNNQAINSAIQGGGAEQSRLFGLGTQSLQNQITARDAPINEYNALQGGAGANATAQTPDIAGAFNQQYQGALAGYNANNAASNADTSAAGSLLGSYLMYLALA